MMYDAVIVIILVMCLTWNLLCFTILHHSAVEFSNLIKPEGVSASSSEFVTVTSLRLIIFL